MAPTTWKTYFGEAPEAHSSDDDDYHDGKPNGYTGAEARERDRKWAEIKAFEAARTITRMFLVHRCWNFLRQHPPDREGARRGPASMPCPRQRVRHAAIACKVEDVTERIPESAFGTAHACA